MTPTFRYLWGILLVAALAGAAGGETIVRTDGTRLEGRIVSQDETEVVIEVRKYGAKMTTSVARQQIREILPDSPQPDRTNPKDDESATGQGEQDDGSPRFVLLELKGRVGVEVQPEFLAKALKLATFRKADYVILSLSVEGDQVAEARKLAELIAAEAGNVTIIAYVRTARQAGVAVALACRQVVFSPGGLISARPVADSSGQRPARNPELSGLLVQAAAMGGHSELLARALAEADEALYLAADDSLSAKPGGQVLTRAGAWWDLTAGPAQRAGLSIGSVAQPEQISGLLELTGSWKRMYVGGNVYLQRSADRAGRDYARKLRQQRREQILAQLKPQLVEIDAEVETLEADARALFRQMKLLEQEYEARIELAEEEYEEAIELINRLRARRDDLNITAMRRDAKDLYEKKLDAIKASFAPHTSKLKREMDKIKAQRQLLIEKRRMLIDEAMEKVESPPGAGG